MRLLRDSWNIANSQNTKMAQEYKEEHDNHTVPRESRLVDFGGGACQAVAILLPGDRRRAGSLVGQNNLVILGISLNTKSNNLHETGSI